MFQFLSTGTDYDGIEFWVPFLQFFGIPIDFRNDSFWADLVIVLVKEMLLALLNGLILAALLLIFTWIWQGDFATALAISVSLIAVIMVAGFIGTFTPLFLDQRGIDPAIATGPFITTSNDIFGILIYFWIAKLILGI